MATINKDDEKIDLPEVTEQSITGDMDDLSDVAGTKQESDNKSLKENSISIHDDNDTTSMVPDQPNEDQIVDEQKNVSEIEKPVSIPVIIEETSAEASDTEGNQSEDIFSELGELEEQVEPEETLVADVNAETISVEKTGEVKEEAPEEDLHIDEPGEIEIPDSYDDESEKTSTDVNIPGEKLTTDEQREETEAEKSESIPDVSEEEPTNFEKSQEYQSIDEPEENAKVEELESIADEPVENIPLDDLGDEDQAEEPDSTVEAHENAIKEDRKEDSMVEMNLEMNTENNQTKSIKENVENVINEGEPVNNSGDDYNTESDEALSSENENYDGIIDQPIPAEKKLFQSISNNELLTPDKKPLTIAIFLGILAIIVAVTTGLYTINLKEQIDSLRNQLVTKTTTVVTTQVKSKPDELDQLKNRISELKTRFEEYNQTLKNSEESWVAVQARIEQLEQSINSGNISKAISPPSSTIIKSESFPATNEGDWIVNLESTNEKDADNALKRYQSKGMSVEKVSIKRSGITWYQLRITGFLSAEEAKGYIKTIASRDAFPYAWIERKQ